MTVEEDYDKIKDMLSKLYSNLKLNFKKTFINIEENEDSDENEENSIKNLSIIDLINCISAYVNNLLERNRPNNPDFYKEEDNEEKPLYKQYEELLIKAEDDIRRHIKVEQQLKIKIEDLEFELDDYRTGKIKKKVKNLICINEPGYYSTFNYQKQKNKFNGYDNYNEANNNVEKPISVNSNNNYIITKLKKENENLKLKLLKLENESNNTTYNSNNDKYKHIDNKIHQKKLNDGIRITKNIINNKNYISKNNYYSFGNNTFTNNFYNLKENKPKINNNSSNNDLDINLKNYTKMIFNHKTSANSFIAHPKKNHNNKNEFIKTFSIFKTDSNKKNNNTKKLIYEKNKTQFKKIHNNFTESNNFIEIKIKDENSNSNYNNINNNNKRIYTLNNNSDAKNVFSKKMNIVKKKDSKLNLNLTNNNLYHTDRKKNNPNNKKDSNSNLAVEEKERNTLYIPKSEFNLTWSKFPLKNIQTSSNLIKSQIPNNNYQKNSIQSLIRNSTNVNNNVNKSLNKKLLSQFKKKNKNNIGSNPNKFPNKIRKDTTPQKITINRRKTMNVSKTNNSSMKNINYINYTKPKVKDEFYMNMKDNIENLMNSCDNNDNMMIKTQNNFYPGKGDIYVRKKRNLAFGIEVKNNKKSENKNKEGNYNYDKIEI